MREIKYKLQELEVIGLWGISVGYCEQKSKKSDNYQASTIPLNKEVEPTTRCGVHQMDAKIKMRKYLLNELKEQGEWESRKILKNRRLEDMTLKTLILGNKFEGGK